MPDKPIARLAVFSAILALAGCVTINIYFPAAAAERAADRIIDQVWQQSGSPATPGEAK